MRVLKKWLSLLQLQVKRPFYFVLLSLVTLMDSFLFVIPTDGILVTSILAYPKAWLRNAMGTIMGSVIGSAIFAWIVQNYGIGAIHYLAPEMEASRTWIQAMDLLNHFGHYAVFIIALSPLPQPPIVALAALSNMPLTILISMLFAGRFIKYILLARIVAKSPHYLPYLRGLQDEIKSAQKASDIKI